jgi:2'-5' RNA ligase
MHEPTQTAVIVPVGAADPAVGEHRRRLDRAAAWGVPAHVTVVFPFVPPAEVTGGVVDRLADVFAAAPAFLCVFAECRWFGDEVLWLAPDPAQEFRELTRAVVERFPAYEPYGGEFEEVVPHLTIGDTPCGSVAALRAAEAEVARRLPIRARIDHALLIAGTDAPDSWRTLAKLPFGPSGS